MALTASFALTGSSRFTTALDLTTTNDTASIGSGNFDAMAMDLASGTASGQANSHWHDERTLTATTSESLDLAGGLTNAFGVAITFTAIKVVIIDIDAPDGTKVLQVGPRNVANAWQAWFGGVGAQAYETVYQSLYRVNEFGGWGTITAGTADLLVINNPGAGSVTYRILLIGVA